MAWVQSGDEHFVYPDREEYDPHEHHRGAFGIFVEPERTTLIRVVLEFANLKWLKYYVREREWQPGQELTDLPDGRLRLSFEVTTLVEVIPWVLQFGEDVTVGEPQELLDAVTNARAWRPDSRSEVAGGSSRSGPPEDDA